MEKNILDAWYLSTELSTGDTVIMPGERKDIRDMMAKLPTCQVEMNMYQIDIGSVYVWPESVTQLQEAQQLEIPQGFDSILVNSTRYVLQTAQIHHAYTLTFDYIRDPEDQTQPKC